MPGLTNLDPETAGTFAREWEALFDRGDHATMAAYYAADAQLIGTHLETITGRSAIARFWEAACQGARAAGLRRTVHVEAVDRDGDLGAVRGTVELRRGAGTTTVRYLTLWRRDAAGAWRISVDISSAAPATP